MSDLTPNPPSSRMRHVIKTYRHSKAPFVAVDTMWITLAMMGRDRAADHFARWAKDVGLADPELIGPEQDWEETFGSAAGWDSFYNAIADPEYKPPGGVESYLPERHEYDFMIPWIARELGRIAKEMRKGRATTEDYNLAANTVFSKAPAIAMWAIQERVDIGRTSLVEALKAIEHFDAFTGEMPQGHVVYRFDDGYTVQRLVEPEELEAEGEAMQHCVGDYCLEEDDRTEIYSLRDERGMPHVTMEWDVEKERFNQIRGKQNEMPVERYRPYLFRFIEQAYGGDPVGLMLAGKDPKEVDFSDQVIDELDFSELAQEGLDFERVEFAGAVLIDCDLTSLNLYMANFNGATIKRCTFQNSELVYADFESAQLEDVDFADAKLYAASFIDATLTGVDFAGFSGVSDLREVAFDNVIIHKVGAQPGMRLPFTTWSHSGAEGFEKMEGADFVNSELSREHIPTDSDVQALQYALGLARVANIDDTPLEDWVAEQGEEHGHRAEEVPYEASDG